MKRGDKAAKIYTCNILNYTAILVTVIYGFTSIQRVSAGRQRLDLVHKYPSFFSHALVISVIPQVATQLHMVFGSTALFDNHFNIAHFLKIVAYLIPFGGLSLDYIQTYREEADTAKQLKQAVGVFSSILGEP